MNHLQEKFEKWKIEREVDEHNESYAFREGYVKAMCDAINQVKNLSLGNVINQRELLKAFLEHIEDTVDYLPCEASELIDSYFKSL